MCLCFMTLLMWLQFFDAMRNISRIEHHVCNLIILTAILFLRVLLHVPVTIVVAYCLVMYWRVIPSLSGQVLCSCWCRTLEQACSLQKPAQCLPVGWSPISNGGLQPHSLSIFSDGPSFFLQYFLMAHNLITWQLVRSHPTDQRDASDLRGITGKSHK